MPPISKRMRQELNDLLTTLAEGAPEERSNATTRLIDHEQSGHISPKALIALSKEDSVAQVMYAIEGMGRGKTPECEARLIEMLNKKLDLDTNPLYAESLIDALGVCGGDKACETLVGLLGLKVGWAGKLKNAISPRTKSHLNPAIQFLKLSIVKALQNIANQRVAVVMGPFLMDEDPLVRWHTIQLLVRADCREHKKTLNMLAKEDEEDMVKEMAQIALDKLHALPVSMNN